MIRGIWGAFKEYSEASEVNLGKMVKWLKKVKKGKMYLEMNRDPPGLYFGSELESGASGGYFRNLRYCFEMFGSIWRWSEDSKRVFKDLLKIRSF